MKTLKQDLTIIAGSLHGNNLRFIFFLLTVAMFVISAGAPNATIGIGK